MLLVKRRKYKVTKVHMNYPKKLVVFNWKSKPSTLKDACLLAQETVAYATNAVTLVLAPPSLYLREISEIVEDKKEDVFLGAQDISPSAMDVVTGDETPRMLIDAGVRYVIVGHSERRYILGETDAVVAEKMHTSMSAGLVPILCVGEREKTSEQAAVLESVRQLSLAVDKKTSGSFVIAYEPVWAIGGDVQVDSTYAASVISGIRDYCAMHYAKNSPLILYGGSVHCGNIESLLYYGHIDGFLVGSASLKVEEIKCIITKIRSGR